ncbi:MAG: TetR family transcriptional regulator [Chloroflexi bacterium]|nr:TetR family transcriptional regulator [Chloroflexota bacterium]MBV9898751.1 TetR family transcriptional regulator [Chloroflexota bacterium]
MPDRRRAVHLDTGVATRQRISPARIDLIRAAARREFAQHGFAGATMRDIAAQAGITISTLYFHCATKEQLLFDVLQDAIERLSTGLDQTLEGAGPSQADRLAAAIRHHILACARQDFGAAVTANELRGLGSRLRRRYVASRDRYEQRFRQIVEAGIIDAEFEPVDVSVIVAGILGIGFNVSRWFKARGRLSAEQVADEYARFVLRGLCKAYRG